MVSDTQPGARNYVDCTESNDDDDDEEEEEGGGKDDDDEVVKGRERNREPEEKKPEESKDSSTNPKWEDFFTAEVLTDSQTSQSQSCCSNPITGSQTPELFSDEGEEETADSFSLALSSSQSNHSSQNMDSSSHQPERGDAGPGEGPVVPPEELPESQPSSDFDVPCSPESKAPQPDELSQLYRKLAAGEDVVVRKGSQGFA